MNNELKQALEFGVPLRETCEKMQWQEETFFFWVKDVTSTIEEIWDVCYYDLQGSCYKSASNNKSIICNDDVDENPEYVVPAPQMHEILKDLPKSILCDGNAFILRQDYSAIGYQSQSKNNVLFYGEFLNYQYAQTYAELWLKLKSENLL